MPEYLYKCRSCGEFEVEQRITDEPLKRCPKKGCRKKVKRLIASTSFHLKGDRWYKDGYGGDSE